MNRSGPELERVRTGSWSMGEVLISAFPMTLALLEIVLMLPAVSPNRGDFASIGEGLVFAVASLVYLFRATLVAPLVLRKLGWRRRVSGLRWALVLTYLTPLLVVGLHLAFDYRSNGLERVARAYVSGPPFLVELFQL